MARILTVCPITGFYSTAQTIIRELQVPDKYVEWI